MSYPKLKLSEITNHNAKLPESIMHIQGIIGLFKQYLRTGYYPLRKDLSSNEQFFSALMNAIDKVIYSDIASYYSLKTTTLDVFKKILYFVATMPPSKINPHSLGQSLGKHHQDVAGYINIMHDSSLLRYLLIDKHGHAMIRNAEKVYINNTNIIYAISNHLGKKASIGTIRELFAINQLQNAKHNVFYSKAGDISVENYVFEIDGKAKTDKQIKGIKKSYLLKDDIVYKSGRSIPLYLLGFLY